MDLVVIGTRASALEDAGYSTDNRSRQSGEKLWKSVGKNLSTGTS